MAGNHFAVYCPPETVLTSKPREQISFVGRSLPHFSNVREALADLLAGYPALPTRRADLDLYLAVHTSDYLQRLRRMAAGESSEENDRPGGECAGYEYCLPAYEFGLGGMLEAIERMEQGSLKRAYCFSLGGHHAYSDWGHGYCLLNPQAAAVRFAQSRGFRRVLLVDWDIHHGDGTQAIFAHDPEVYCISIHSAVDLYMGKAAGWQSATVAGGQAIGHCNIPILHVRYDVSFIQSLNLPGPFFRGSESLSAFRQALGSVPWKPDLICIFSGYDGHREDCGRNITNWTDDDFAELTRAVLAVAEECSCPVLSVHGGGYQLPVTVSAALRHVETLVRS
jgi:acetoin utilization deacetylase AcuC-like enzyme